MPISILQAQADFVFSLTNIQHEIKETSLALEKLANQTSAEDLEHIARLENYVDYLNRRHKLYQTILSSENINSYLEIEPFVEEYEAKVQYLYFHKQESSYVTKMNLEEKIKTATANENEILCQQLEICKLELVVQHLELILIQVMITDILKITNILHEMQPQIKQQQQAYCLYIEKLSSVLHFTRLINSQKKLKHAANLDLNYTLNVSKLFGVRLEEHFAWCVLQHALKINNLSESNKQKFQGIIAAYHIYQMQTYASSEQFASDFIVSPDLLEKIVHLNSLLGDQNFPNIIEIIELYAHSIVVLERQQELHMQESKQIDSMAHTLVSSNAEAPAHDKPRSKLII